MTGPHLALFAAIGRVHPQVLGKTLPLNGAGVCGAALADLGLPLELLRGFALLARTAGLIGQLAEELRHPVANDIFLSVDLNNKPCRPGPHTPPTAERRRSWLSWSRSSRPPTTRSTTGRATSTGADRPPFADEWVARSRRSARR